MNGVMKIIIKSLCCIFFLSCCSYVCMASDNAVYLRGSTTLAPIARKVAEAYMVEHPGARILVDTGGTERGYQSVMNGTTDIAMVSSAYCDVSSYECANDKLLKKESLGCASIKVVVHKSNSIINLTVNQLRDIFTGRITNWNEVGGNNEGINVYLNPPRSGIGAALKNKLNFKNEDSYTPKGWVKNGAKLLKSVASDKNGIAIAVFNASVVSNIKLVDVDGVSATAVAPNKPYPLQTELMLVTRQERSPEINNFIRYFVDYKNQHSLANFSTRNCLVNQHE